jgi:hypothetical protein
MEQFKKSLVEAIENTNEEFESPSREYTKNDGRWVSG